MTLLFEQLIFDILLRLPVKPLIQFKSVCKSWNVLISSPEFIACHNQYNETHYNACRNYYLMSGRLKNCTRDEDGDDEQHDAKDVGTSMISSFHLDKNNWDSDSSSVVSPTLRYLKVQSILDDPHIGVIKICGPCNGLYCLDIRPWLTFGLINPSLREFKLLPRYDTSWVNLREEDCVEQNVYGFGFDPLANDYKIVAMIVGGEVGWQAVLYSLNSNSWKQVTFPIPFI